MTKKEIVKNFLQKANGRKHDMNNKLNSTLSLKVQVQPDNNHQKTTVHPESTSYYKKHGYKQTNIFLDKNDDYVLTTVCELLGMAKKDFAIQAVKIVLEQYKDAVETVVALRKQYEDALKTIKLA